MKMQPGKTTTRASSRLTAWRAVFSRVFHSKPAYTVSRPQEKLADVVVDEALLDEALLNELRGLVDQLKSSHSSANGTSGAVLITGQAGTGKTLLARALAGEVGAPLFSLRLDAVTPRDLSRLVRQAREAAPAVVLLEAVDAVDEVRPAEISPGSQRTAQVSAALHRLAVDPRILLVGTARCQEQVRPALMGLVAFKRRIHLDLPDQQARQQILGLHTRALKLAKDVNLGMIARATSGFSGGDLARLCQQAAEYSTLRGSPQINMMDFEQAVDQALLAVTGNNLINEQARRTLAYHEAGHALAAWINPVGEPIQRISLLHRWQLRFDPETTPEYHQVGISKMYLLALLSVLLAGRAGEEAGLGEITTGAENDLIEATALAHRMVTRWGMGRLGPVSFDQLAAKGSLHEAQRHETGAPTFKEPAYSEATAARIDQDVQELLQAQYQAVCQQLKEARPALDRLAEALLEDETVHQKEIARILGPRPFFRSGLNGLLVDVSDVRQPSKIS